MTLKKIFIGLVLLPHFVLWLVVPFLEQTIKGFYQNDYGVLGYLLLATSLLGGFFIIYKNFSHAKSLGWYVVAALIILINSFLIYTAYSFSNFGF